MRRIIILGAGGQGQVIADILQRMRDQGQEIEPIGFLDDASLQDRSFLGVPVLGRVADLHRIAHDGVIIGIGDNRTRARLFERYQDEHFAIARHPSAIIAPDVDIGPGTVIAAGTIIAPGTTIGRNSIVNTGSTVDHHNHIGDHVHIAPGVHLGGAVDVAHGTLIGIGSIVTPQRHIGAWSIVGAGALVLTDVADTTLVYGVPARLIRPLETTM